MAMAVAVPSPAPRQLWENAQSKHGGWVVKVLQVSPLAVRFEVVRGPSKSLKSRHSKPIQGFVRDFRFKKAA